MPDEQLAVQQLNEDRAAHEFRALKAKGIKGRIAAMALKEVAERITIKMLQAVEKKSIFVWIFALSLAVLKDFVIDGLNAATAGLLHLVVICVNILVWLILYMFTSSLDATGPLLALRIKILMWACGIIESVPLIGGAPTWTIGLLWIWYKVNKRSKLAEQGLRQLEKGKLPSKNTQKEFA